jgi:hypothetical protein
MKNRFWGSWPPYSFLIRAGALLLVMFLSACETVFSQTIYNIDFNAPAQPPNQLVRTGTPPQFVSQINFGSPIVSPSFGSLTDQPLVLNMVSNAPSFYYDQIQLNLTQMPPTTLDVGFDFTSQGLVGSSAQFSVTFDTYSVRDVQFWNNGTISLSLSPFGITNVGTFSNNEEFRVGIHIDLAQHQWSLSKNGSVLGGGAFIPDDYIHDIRFSYGLQSSTGTPDSSAVGIDNLIVGIPEPGICGLLSLATAFIVLRLGKQHNI